MAAITWRNVGGPSSVGELNALANAGSMITGSFDQLGKVLTNYQQEEGRQFQQRKDDNTLAFQQALHDQFTTPEAMQAAIADGTIARMREQFGKEINAKDVLGYEQKLLADRQNQVKTGNEFADHQTARKEKPVIQEAMRLAVAGDYDSAFEMVKGLSNEGEVTQMLQEAQRGNIRFDRESEKHEWGIKQTQANIRSSDASANASNASAAASRANTRLTNIRADEAILSAEEKLKQREVDNFVAQRASESNQLVQAEREVVNNMLRQSGAIKEFPNDGRGNVDITKFTTEDVAKWKALRDQQIKDGAQALPDIEQLFNSSARNAQNTFAEAERVFGANYANKALANINTLFDASPNRATGAEAAARKKMLNELEEAQRKERAEQYPDPTTPKGKQELRTGIRSALEARFGKEDAKVTNDYMEEFAKLIHSGGVSVAGGKKILPSVADMQLIVDSLDPDYLQSRSGELQEALRDYYRSKAGKDLSYSEIRRLEDQLAKITSK